MSELYIYLAICTGAYVLALMALFQVSKERKQREAFRWEVETLAANLEAYKGRQIAALQRIENAVVDAKTKVQDLEGQLVTGWKRLDELTDLEARAIVDSVKDKIGEDGLTDMQRYYKAIDDDF
jgi:Tfp pilus assembly protein PilO